MEANSALRPSRDAGRSPRKGSLSHAWRTLARSPWLAMLSIGTITLAVSMTLAFVRWPQPNIHDEFSYLLSADTFAHGRLSNPTHPLGRYFESFHIIQQPSYASKYPPGQGLLLALGQLLTGTPLAGVWLSMSLASMALVWMLAGWVPWRWAMLGGLVFALHTNIQFHWGHSYWGGAVAFTGGALLFGALPRLLKQPRVLNALLLATGAVVLAMTRPYEGAIACAGVGSVLVWQQVRNKLPHWKQFFSRLVLPAAIMLMAGIGFLALYNQAVTGHPIRLPYSVHEATYGSSPLFVWQAEKPLPQYQHESLRAFHTGWGLDAWRQHQSLGGFVQAKFDGTVGLWSFYFGALLTVPLIAAPRVWRDRRLRFALVMLATLYGASLLVFWMLPHYFAPAAPLLFLVLIEAVRHVHTAARQGWPVAHHAPGYLVAAQLVLLLSATFTVASDQAETWADARAAIVAELTARPGQHLVLVTYGPDHNVHQDWVYNGADLADAKVLWARSLGPKEDRPLVEHFASRQVWRLNVDADPRKLELVSPAAAAVLPAANPFDDDAP